MGTRRLSTPNGDFTLFYTFKSPFSNFFRCNFNARAIDGKLITCNCVEQFYMYNKAISCDDSLSATCVLRGTDPKMIKRMGAQLKAFDQTKWEKYSERVMKTALEAKFSQNEELRKLLFMTHGSTLAECSPTDTVWGIGISIDSEEATDPTKWKGTNKLGQVMMAVRTTLWNDEKFKADREETEEALKTEGFAVEYFKVRCPYQADDIGHYGSFVHPRCDRLDLRYINRRNIVRRRDKKKRSRTPGGSRKKRSPRPYQPSEFSASSSSSSSRSRSSGSRTPPFSKKRRESPSPRRYGRRRSPSSSPRRYRRGGHNNSYSNRRNRSHRSPSRSRSRTPKRARSPSQSPKKDRSPVKSPIAPAHVEVTDQIGPQLPGAFRKPVESSPLYRPSSTDDSRPPSRHSGRSTSPKQKNGDVPLVIGPIQPTDDTKEEPKSTLVRRDYSEKESERDSKFSTKKSRSSPEPSKHYHHHKKTYRRERSPSPHYKYKKDKSSKKRSRSRSRDQKRRKSRSSSPAKYRTKRRRSSDDKKSSTKRPKVEEKTHKKSNKKEEKESDAAQPSKDSKEPTKAPVVNKLLSQLLNKNKTPYYYY